MNEETFTFYTNYVRVGEKTNSKLMAIMLYNTNDFPRDSYMYILNLQGISLVQYVPFGKNTSNY